MKTKECPYCLRPKHPMIQVQIDDYTRAWRCQNPEFKSSRPYGGQHDDFQWKCGLCGRWGSNTIISDKGSPTGHSHVACWDRELIHVTCSCGLDEHIPRGGGFGIIFAQQHKGEGHDLKGKRTFKLAGKGKVTTIVGREINTEARQ